ncbi:TetR/AcrR family transcriptional regulator [Actinokineospora sp.]|uniref:TetR/AcrR family transcriptional regulator n=1 Tax=Actinokineospora sp. TaxID=1872133 RepID=UPI0040384994
MAEAARQPVTAPAKRGAHLLDAVVEVVADGGITAVSMRSVAAAAGVSLAQVQYYFRSKDELVAAAFEHVSEGVEGRAADLDTSGPPRMVLRRLLELWLPSTAERARDARVWVAFTAAAMTSAPLREINTRIDRDLRAGFSGLLRQAQATGDLDPALDPDVHAAVLLAVVDGLVTQAVLAPEDGRADLAARGLDAHLSRLFADQEQP